MNYFLPLSKVPHSLQLVLWADVTAGCHGPAHGGEGKRGVPGPGLHEHHRWLRALCQVGAGGFRGEGKGGVKVCLSFIRLDDLMYRLGGGACDDVRMCFCWIRFHNLLFTIQHWVTAYVLLGHPSPWASRWCVSSHTGPWTSQNSKEAPAPTTPHSTLNTEGETHHTRKAGATRKHVHNFLIYWHVLQNYTSIWSTAQVIQAHRATAGTLTRHTDLRPAHHCRHPTLTPTPYSTELPVPDSTSHPQLPLLQSLLSIASPALLADTGSPLSLLLTLALQQLPPASFTLVAPCYTWTHHITHMQIHTQQAHKNTPWCNSMNWYFCNMFIFCHMPKFISEWHHIHMYMSILIFL